MDNFIFRIQDVLACSFLDDLLELRDQDLAKDAQEANWFSAPSALRVYGKQRGGAGQGGAEWGEAGWDMIKHPSLLTQRW